MRKARKRVFLGDDGGDKAQAVSLDAAGKVAFHEASGFRLTGARGLTAALAALAGER